MSDLMKVFSITGYWADDKESIDGYLVAEFDCTPKGYSDDDIFWYGLSEQNIKEMIKNKEDLDDFVITGYELYEDTEVTKQLNTVRG